MKFFQRDKNSNWYTSEDIICSMCDTPVEYAYGVRPINDLENEIIYCAIDCFSSHFLSYEFELMEEAYIRRITDVKFKRKEKTKRRNRNKISYRLRYLVLKRDTYICVFCGSRDRLEIDHILPISFGGETIEDNLQTLCFKCNRGKSNYI